MMANCLFFPNPILYNLNVCVSVLFGCWENLKENRGKIDNFLVGIEYEILVKTQWIFFSWLSGFFY